MSNDAKPSPPPPPTPPRPPAPRPDPPQHFEKSDHVPDSHPMRPSETRQDK
jgi:hypothetical protein